MIDLQPDCRKRSFSLSHFLSSVYNYSVPEPEDDFGPWRFCHLLPKNRE